MKKIISGILVAAVSLSAITAKAQTADEIVNKYIDALGGKDVINKVTSIYMEGSTQMMGADNPTTITILNGKGYKSETNFNGQKIIQCYTDKGGWTVNPMGGGNAEAMPEEAYKAAKGQINIGGPLYDYAAKGNTVTLLGKEGKNYKLKVVTKEKVESTFFIDDASYYVSKVVAQGNMGGQAVEVTLSFADYKKTDIGFSVPFTTNIDLGQFQLSTTYTKAEVNKTIDPAVFNMPK